MEREGTFDPEEGMDRAWELGYSEEGREEQS